MATIVIQRLVQRLLTHSLQPLMFRDRTQTARDEIHLPLTFFHSPCRAYCAYKCASEENYINWTCKSWTISTDGYNCVHLNDNGLSASCFSQRTLTPAIITTERVISLLWETYNTQKVFFSPQRCARSSQGIFSGF